MEADDIEEVLDLGDGPAEGDATDDADLDGVELAPEDFEDVDDAEQAAASGSGSAVAGPDMAARHYREHASSVYAGAISVDGRTVVTGSGDDTAHIWDAVTCERRHTLKGHTDTVVAVGFSHDGKLVATGGYDSKVLVWRTDSCELVTELEGPGGEIEWLDWHSRGDVVLAGSSDGTAWMWSIDKGEATCMQVFAGHEAAVTCGGFSSTGKSVITGSADATVRVWNPKTGSSAAHFAGHGWCEGPVNCVVMQDTAPILCATSQDGTARIANVATNKILITLQHDTGGGEEEQTTSVESASFSTVQPWVATGATDSSVKVWDIASGSIRCSVHASGGVIKVGWVPASPHLLLATTATGSVCLWDVRNGSALKEYTGHAGMILDYFATPEFVGTCGDDAVVRLFNW